MKYYLEAKDSGKRTKITRENALYYIGKLVRGGINQTLESYEKDTIKENKIALTFNYLVLKK